MSFLFQAVLTFCLKYIRYICSCVEFTVSRIRPAILSFLHEVVPKKILLFKQFIIAE